jgi:tetratricopeptide (TPR) repeat protein
LFLQLYYSPLKAFSRILDEGRLLFALGVAVAALLAVQLPRTNEYYREQAKQRTRAIKAKVARMEEEMRRRAERKEAAPDSRQSAAAREDDGDDDELSSLMPPARFAAPSFAGAADRLMARDPTQYLAPMFALAICFVPMAILILTVWDNLGGFTTILFRDYLSLLVCCLLAWAAPYLILAAANQALRAGHLPAYDHPALWWVAQTYFLVLAVLAFRTVFGTKFLHAAGAAAGGCAASLGGVILYSVFGSVTAYLASPFVLYYLWAGLGPEVRSLGTGLHSRQRLKQRLENSTLNPRDADAHYQLGLIYAQRRQYQPAMECFRKATGIDPDEADAHYQLGRIAREQGRFADALEHCYAAARIDDKHSSSEVWREIGIVNLLSGKDGEAAVALEKYLSRRPYDPEGECWYGRALMKLGRAAEARAAFEQAIEAVRTMPTARMR